MGTHGISPPSGADFKMIDVGDKADTKRRATASGKFFAKAETLRMITEKRIPKGDVLALAVVAGIQGAKSTAALLPLCHPLPLNSVRVWTEVASDHIQVFCEASTVGKTGVEMEALTGVSLALLCMHDLTKMVDPEIRFGDILLERKEGGKSGVWTNPAVAGEPAAPAREREKTLAGRRFCLLTVSDRCSRGEREDGSGASMKDWLAERGAEIAEIAMVPDEPREIARRIEEWIERTRPDAILTTGGTGLAPRDVTPEVLKEMQERLKGREIPGVGELLRSSGARKTEKAWLSRSLGVHLGGSLVVALPGSPKAVREGLDALETLFPHLFHVASGGDHVGAHEVR